MRRGLGGLAAATVLTLACAGTAGAESWLAGDVHVHTCYSHDAWCPGEPPQEEALYSSHGTVAQRFQEAALKGLDFLVVSDHNDVGAQSDPGFGTAGVLGVPAYEASLAGGHAQMLGATRVYDDGSGDATSTNALADALRLDGGVFQANHPADSATEDFTACEQADIAAWNTNPLHWKYGYAVLPDSIEVWNTTTLIQPSQLFYECWLQRGARIGITGASDSHGANQANVALPTTWVRASGETPAAVIDAIRAGRTTVSRVAPAGGGARLLIEADRDRDGSYESSMGDQVPSGTPMRVRADRQSGTGLVRVRANGTTLVDGEPLPPGGEVAFTAPADEGWAYAVLYMADGTSAVDPGCRPLDQPVSTCSEDLAIAAMTSPIWTRPPLVPAVDTAGAGITPFSTGPEPDDGPPVPAGRQSGGASDLPAVPAVGTALRSLKLRSTRRGRLAARWTGGGPRYRVERRRGGGHWRVVRSGTRRRALRMRAAPGRHALRVRSQPPGGTPGPWRTARTRFR
jgi:hypothetical protein